MASNGENTDEQRARPGQEKMPSLQISNMFGWKIYVCRIEKTSSLKIQTYSER